MSFIFLNNLHTSTVKKLSVGFPTEVLPSVLSPGQAPPLLACRQLPLLFMTGRPFPRHCTPEVSCGEPGFKSVKPAFLLRRPLGTCMDWHRWCNHCLSRMPVTAWYFYKQLRGNRGVWVSIACLINTLPQFLFLSRIFSCKEFQESTASKSVDSYLSFIV